MRSYQGNLHRIISLILNVDLSVITYTNVQEVRLTVKTCSKLHRYEKFRLNIEVYI